jgi:hypothetical protein
MLCIASIYSADGKTKSSEQVGDDLQLDNSYSSNVENTQSEWEIIPIGLEKIETGQGWTTYQLSLAIKNVGVEFSNANFTLEGLVVETDLGFEYEIGDYRISSYYKVPPNFSLPMKPIKFEVAEAASPIKMRPSNFETINLKEFKNVNFPTDTPDSQFLSIGDMVEVPNIARVHFTEAYRTGASQFNAYSGAGVGLHIKTVFENLNKGYDTNLNEQCYLYDGTGSVYRNEGSLFAAGPGQTIEVDLAFNYWRFYSSGMDVSEINRTWENAKLVCIGEFDEIFNVEISYP